MSLTPRHAWLSEKVAQSFGLQAADVQTFVVSNKGRVDSFFNDVDSEPKLFFFYQSSAAGAGKKELSLTLGMFFLLPSSSLSHFSSDPFF